MAQIDLSDLIDARLSALGVVIFTDYGALPTATSALRGKMVTVFGGTGVADATWQCLKASGGTYSWVQVA